MRRAKCHEQLGEADSAFEDATYIIREFDGDPVSTTEQQNEDEGEEKSSAALKTKEPRPPRSPSNDAERRILYDARLLASRVESKANEMRKEKTEKVMGQLKVRLPQMIAPLSLPVSSTRVC